MIKGAERLALDPLLARARSFRPGWGPSGWLAHNGVILPSAASGPQSLSTIRLSHVQLSPPVNEKAQAMLQLQFENTIVEFDEEAGVPLAAPALDLRFRHFASAFAANERTHESQLWRLGQALFDEIELGLSQDTSRELHDAALDLRRKADLSRWLSSSVTTTVEAEARGHMASQRTASLIFSYLTANQLERAAMTALETKNFRLATLLSQLPGDEEMRADIAEQLATWREEGVDSCISTEYRKLYELMAGNVTVSNGTVSTSLRDPSDRVPDLSIAEGLDWKRTFGLHLWYHTPHNARLERAVETYQDAVARVAGTAPPLPPYPAEDSKKTSKDSDVLWHLLNIYSDPLYSLEQAITPRGYGASLADYRISWQLYQLVSRVLRLRDFSDRTVVDDAEAEVMDADGERSEIEGNSATADRLTSDLAAQLESQGLIHWSAFVLLHLELPSTRAVALKGLLDRNIQRLSAEQEEFLTSRLLVPVEWIASCRAHLAASKGDLFNVYRLQIEAGEHAAAHAIAARDLAPEAIIRGDHNLLLSLFAAFPPDVEIPGWLYGGQILVDWVACQRNLPPLLAAVMAADTDASQQENGPARHQQRARLDKLCARVLELLKLVPTVLYRDEDDTEEADARGRLTRYVARTDSTSLDSLHLTLTDTFSPQSSVRCRISRGSSHSTRKALQRLSAMRILMRAQRARPAMRMAWRWWKSKASKRPRWTMSTCCCESCRFTPPPGACELTFLH